MGAENLELGPCKVEFGTDGSETDYGLTLGGVIAHFGTSSVDLLADQTGETPQDTIITGQPTTVDVPLAEITMDNIALALNQTKKHYGGNVGIPGVSKVGRSLLDNAASLVLTKYVDGVASTDSEDKFKFPKAAPIGSVEIGFTKENQRILMVTFKCYPDASGYTYLIGDEDAAELGS